MKINDITYSSEYVAELENKIEYLKEENAELKHKHFILECDVHYLEMYKEALKTSNHGWRGFLAVVIFGKEFHRFGMNKNFMTGPSIETRPTLLKVLQSSIFQ